MDVEVVVCPQGGFNPSVNEHPGAASSSWGQDGPGTHFCQLRLQRHKVCFVGSAHTHLAPALARSSSGDSLLTSRDHSPRNMSFSL